MSSDDAKQKRRLFPVRITAGDGTVVWEPGMTMEEQLRRWKEVEAREQEGGILGPDGKPATPVATTSAVTRK